MSRVIYPYITIINAPKGVECPSIGNLNTVGVKARIHHTVQISSYCKIGARCLLVPPDETVLEDYSVRYGSDAEERQWSGRGKVQEWDLLRKHGDYLREMLPKFNRLRRMDGP